MSVPYRRPSAAFVGASWFALLCGGLTFCIGLWNSAMSLETKGFLFTVLMYGLFSAVSVQKSVRDRLEGIAVTPIYYALSWFSVLLCLLLMAVGLWFAPLTLAEKGFYSMAYVLSLFAAITVQKNTRDSAVASAKFGMAAESDNVEFAPVIRT